MVDEQPIPRSEPEPKPVDDGWPKAWSVGFICFLVGLAVAAITCNIPEFRLTGFIVTIVIAFIIRGAREVAMGHEEGMAQLRAKARKEELQLLKERAAVEQREIKLHKAAEKAKRQTIQIDNSYVFTSNDFDDAAQGLLLGPVKAARKAKAKVTGQGLIETFLKGVR